MKKEIKDLNIPDHLKSGLNLYLFEHIQPGHFLSAILQKDVEEALGRADSICRPLVKEIIQVLDQCPDIPKEAWGSTENFYKHLTLKRKITKPQVEKHKCHCQIDDLMNFGCKCSGC